MKHKGATMEYAQERLDDLMRAYDEHISSVRHIRMPDVYRAVVDMPSRRFWVSDIRAALVVSAIMRGEARLETMWPLKREMYMEIHRRVAGLKRERPGISTAEACSIVVEQPAPKFYLSPNTAKIMICRYRGKWVERKLQRLLSW